MTAEGITQYPKTKTDMKNERKLASDLKEVSQNL